MLHGLQLCRAALGCLWKPFPSEDWERVGWRWVSLSQCRAVIPPPNAERFVYPHQLLHPSLLRAIYKALNSIAPGTQGTKGDNNSRKEPNGFIFSLPPPNIKQAKSRGGHRQAPPNPAPIHTTVPLV